MKFMEYIESLLPYCDRGVTFFADSRKAAEEGVFFALKGERVDGHAFLQKVALKGAHAAVVSQDYLGPSFGLELIFVADVREALQNFAAFVRSQRIDQKVVGVTGSVGKTTVKEFIATLLSERFSIDKSKGSENSQVSLPLTILNSDPEAEFLVLEMGMSQKGEMRRLTKIAQPDYVVVTRIGLSHASSFESLEEIAAAKAEILESDRVTLLVIEEKSAQFDIFKKAPVRKIIFSLKDKWPPLPLAFQASHLLENLAGAIALCRTLGLEWDEIRRGCLDLKPCEKRFEQVVKKGVIFLNDSYNASLDATLAALQNMPEPLAGGKKIAVLGEMRELGKFSKSSHEMVGAKAKEHVKMLLTYGEETRWTRAQFGESSEDFDSKEALLERLREIAKEGDVVLLKGANSLRMWTLLEDY